MRTSTPRPPLSVRAKADSEPSIVSSPPWPFTTIESVASSVVMVVVAARPVIVADVAGRRRWRSLSLPLRAVDGHHVALAVADRSAQRRRQVDHHLLHVGAGHVADHDVVGAAERVEVDALDIVQVHGDGRRRRGRSAARAPLAEDVDVLAGVGAVEQQRVDAGLALDGVVAVARIPLERIVAGAEQARRRCPGRRRRSRCRRRRSACRRPALPRIVSLPAPPSSVSLIDAGREGRGRQRVVAAEAVDRRACRWRPRRSGQLHERRQPGDRDRRARADNLR